MNSEQQRQQQSNHVKDCILAPFKCLGYLLIFFFMLGFGVIDAILFGGPLIYYRGTILNSNALAEKYNKEGVRLQGKVIARWTRMTGKNNDRPIFHVRLGYQVDQDRYVLKNDMVVSQVLYSQQSLDLVRLPGYRKSAILLASIGDMMDPDFPPPKLRSVVFAFSWTMLFNIYPAFLVLILIEASDVFAKLIVIGPVICGMIVLEFVVGYWVAKRERDNNLKSVLYGAKRVARRNFYTGAADDAIPKYMSYSIFVDEGKHSCISVISNIVLDLITAVAFIGYVVYLYFFGGGYMIMYSLVVARWEDKLLHRYESESTQVVGSIVCRHGPQKRVVIVQYKVDAQVYKKRLVVPLHIRDDETVPDGFNLLYITDSPASATLKCQIDNRQEERKMFHKITYAGLFCTLIQVGLTAALLRGILVQINVDRASGDLDYDLVYLHYTRTFLILAGILFACHIIFGFIGGCIYYEFFFKRELLHGAKRVFPRATENDEVLVDEEQEIDTAVSLEQGWDTADESASIVETFVDNFMKGNFLPHKAVVTLFGRPGWGKNVQN